MATEAEIKIRANIDLLKEIIGDIISKINSIDPQNEDHCGRRLKYLKEKIEAEDMLFHLEKDLLKCLPHVGNASDAQVEFTRLNDSYSAIRGSYPKSNG